VNWEKNIMNDELNFNVLAFAYLVRGLDKFSDENELPHVGDEDHPELYEGEYEALAVIYNDLCDWLNAVTPMDVPLSAFYYDFVECILPPLAYSSPFNGGVAAVLLDDFTKTFKPPEQGSRARIQSKDQYHE